MVRKIFVWAALAICFFSVFFTSIKIVYSADGNVVQDALYPLAVLDDEVRSRVTEQYNKLQDKYDGIDILLKPLFAAAQDIGKEFLADELKGKVNDTQVLYRLMTLLYEGEHEQLIKETNLEIANRLLGSLTDWAGAATPATIASIAWKAFETYLVEWKEKGKTGIWRKWVECVTMGKSIEHIDIGLFVDQCNEPECQLLEDQLAKFTGDEEQGLDLMKMRDDFYKEVTDVIAEKRRVKKAMEDARRNLIEAKINVDKYIKQAKARLPIYFVSLNKKPSDKETEEAVSKYIDSGDFRWKVSQALDDFFDNQNAGNSFCECVGHTPGSVEHRGCVQLFLYDEGARVEIKKTCQEIRAVRAEAEETCKCVGFRESRELEDCIVVYGQQSTDYRTEMKNHCQAIMDSVERDKITPQIIAQRSVSACMSNIDSMASRLRNNEISWSEYINNTPGSCEECDTTCNGCLEVCLECKRKCSEYKDEITKQLRDDEKKLRDEIDDLLQINIKIEDFGVKCDESCPAFNCPYLESGSIKYIGEFPHWIAAARNTAAPQGDALQSIISHLGYIGIVGVGNPEKPEPYPPGWAVNKYLTLPELSKMEVYFEKVEDCTQRFKDIGNNILEQIDNAIEERKSKNSTIASIILKNYELLRRMSPPFMDSAQLLKNKSAIKGRLAAIEQFRSETAQKKPLYEAVVSYNSNLAGHYEDVIEEYKEKYNAFAVKYPFMDPNMIDNMEKKYNPTQLAADVRKAVLNNNLSGEVLNRAKQFIAAGKQMSEAFKIVETAGFRLEYEMIGEGVDVGLNNSMPMEVEGISAPAMPGYKCEYTNRRCSQAGSMWTMDTNVKFYKAYMALYKILDRYMPEKLVWEHKQQYGARIAGSYAAIKQLLEERPPDGRKLTPEQAALITNIKQQLTEAVADISPYLTEDSYNAFINGLFIDEYNKILNLCLKISDTNCAICGDIETLRVQIKSLYEEAKSAISIEGTSLAGGAFSSGRYVRDNDLIDDKILIEGQAQSKGSSIDKIEISVDKGVSWQTAQGAESWQYYITPSEDIQYYSVKVRVTDKLGRQAAITLPTFEYQAADPRVFNIKVCNYPVREGLKVTTADLFQGKIAVAGEAVGKKKKFDSVLVSLDKGRNWETAQGKEKWTYSFAAPDKTTTYGLKVEVRDQDGWSSPLRMYDITYEVVEKEKTKIDLSIEKIEVSNSNPRAGDSLDITVYVRNNNNIGTMAKVDLEVDSVAVESGDNINVLPGEVSSYSKSIVVGGKSGQHKIRAAVLLISADGEDPDSGNNTKEITITAEAAPVIINLSLVDTVSVKPTLLHELGEKVNISFSVKNTGMTLDKESSVSVLIWERGANKSDLIEEFTIPKLKQGEGKSFSLKPYAINKEAKYSVQIQIDRDNKLEEEDERDNMFIIPIELKILRPNLTVEPIIIDPIEVQKPGDVTVIKVSAKNTGEGVCPKNKAKAEIYVGGKLVMGRLISQDVKPQETAGILSMNYNTSEPGKFEVKVVLDSENAVEEEKEDDNSAAGYFEVAVPKIPNLVLESLTLDPDKLERINTKVKISAAVKNIGSALVPAKKARFAVYAGGGKEYEEILDKDLEPGQTRVFIWEYLAKYEGKHNIEAVIDYQNKVYESREDDNSKTAELAVALDKLADLTVSHLIISPDKIQAGDTITMTFEVKNSGRVAIPEKKAKAVIYLDNDKVYEEFLPQIDFGAARSFSPQHKALKEGKYKLKLALDPDNTIKEEKEDDNEKEIDLIVNERKYVDFQIADVNADKTTVKENEPVKFKVTVKNAGNIGSVKSKLRFKVDGELLTGYTSLAEIKAGASVTLKETELSLKGAGSHVVTAVVVVPDDDYTEPLDLRSNNSKEIKIEVKGDAEKIKLEIYDVMIGNKEAKPGIVVTDKELVNGAVVITGKTRAPESSPIKEVSVKVNNGSFDDNWEAKAQGIESWRYNLIPKRRESYDVNIKAADVKGGTVEVEYRFAYNVDTGAEKGAQLSDINVVSGVVSNQLDEHGRFTVLPGSTVVIEAKIRNNDKEKPLNTEVMLNGLYKPWRKKSKRINLGPEKDIIVRFSTVMSDLGDDMLSMWFNDKRYRPEGQYFRKIDVNVVDYVHSKPDLSVADVDITPWQVYRIGESINIKFDVKNKAADMSVVSQAGVFIWPAGANEKNLISEHTIPKLKHGEVMSFSVKPYPINKTGTYRVSVEIDPANKLAEENEDNNLVVSPVECKLPNLIVDEFQATPSRVQVGKPVNIEAVVKNAGEGFMFKDKAKAVMYLDDKKIKEVVLPELGTGKTYRYSHQETAVAEGKHEIKVMLDVDDAVEESVEDDNKGIAEIEVIEKIIKAPVRIDDVRINSKAVSSYQKAGKIEIGPQDLVNGEVVLSCVISTPVGNDVPNYVEMNFGGKRINAELIRRQLIKAYPVGSRTDTTWSARCLLTDNLKREEFEVFILAVGGETEGEISYDFVYIDTSKNIKQEAQNAINEIKQAFSDKRRSAIIKYLSDDCYNAMDIEDDIERGIEEINVLENLNVNVNNMLEKDSQVTANITWEKSVVNSSGQRESKRRQATIVFKREGDIVKITKAENMFWQPIISAGTTGGGALPVHTATLQGFGGWLDLSSGTISSNHHEVFDVQFHLPPEGVIAAGSDMGGAGQICKVGPGSLEDYTEAPCSAGCNWNTRITGASDGEIYAVTDGEGNYALIEVTSVSYEWTGATMGIRYKYQPSGTRNLP